MNVPGETVIDKNGTQWMVIAVSDLRVRDYEPSTVTITLWREGFEPFDVTVTEPLASLDTYRATATISEQLGAEALDEHAQKILDMQKYLRERLGGAEYQRRVNELWGRGKS